MFDQIVATRTPDWYRPIRGIGPKSADDIEKKLDQRYIRQLTAEDKAVIRGLAYGRK